MTGAAGFVGGHLVRECESHGIEVVQLSRDRADVLDADAVRTAVADAGPDLVVHLAAAASVGASWERPREAIAVNSGGTLAVLEAVRAEAPAARVLLACSGEEYGAVPEERQPVTEDEPLAPPSPYAVGKAAADWLGGLYGTAHGLHVVRTRAFNHAGPGQSDAYIVSAFARQIAERERTGRVEVVTGNPQTRRDYCDVRDVVRAYRLCLELGEAGAVYNVCSGVATSGADILAGLAEHTAAEVTGRTDPARVRPHEVMQIHGSHDRLTAATGWRPEIPLERTLADTLDWWREELAR